MFITFEGTEGSGKSLQCRRLVERLRAHGLGVVATHEPGGTELGNELRHLVLQRDELRIVPRAEALLMNASRAQLVDELIRPALDRGEIVVSDRFADSTIAYQGAGRGLDLHALETVVSFATAGLTPDMTLLLDLPVREGLARKLVPGQGAASWNRFEAETLAFHERVRAAFHELAKAEPERWHCLNALRPANELADEIWRLVGSALGLPT